MSVLYVLWFLLPLAFLLLALWAMVKPKRRGKESPREYLEQGVFCAIALAIAIAIDQTVLEDLFYAVTAGVIDVMFARWMLYPAVLLVLAYLNRFVRRKKVPTRTIPGAKYAPRR